MSQIRTWAPSHCGVPGAGYLELWGRFENEVIRAGVYRSVEDLIGVGGFNTFIYISLVLEVVRESVGVTRDHSFILVTGSCC